MCNELFYNTIDPLDKFLDFIRIVRRSLKYKDNWDCVNEMKDMPLFSEHTVDLFKRWQKKWQTIIAEPKSTSTYKNITNLFNQCDNFSTSENFNNLDKRYLINTFLEYFPANLVAFYPKW